MKSTQILILLAILSGCSQAPKQQIKKSNRSTTKELKGIWMPEKIDWAVADFDTYYFSNDSSVIIFSSVQKKKGDSISFNTEEGFNIKKGALICLSSGDILIKAHTVWRFIKQVDAKGNEMKSDTVIVLRLKNGSRKCIRLNNLTYVPANQYTKESKQSVVNIASKMARCP